MIDLEPQCQVFSLAVQCISAYITVVLVASKIKGSMCTIYHGLSSNITGNSLMSSVKMAPFC